MQFVGYDFNQFGPHVQLDKYPAMYISPGKNRNEKALKQYLGDPIIENQVKWLHKHADHKFNMDGEDEDTTDKKEEREEAKSSE